MRKYAVNATGLANGAVVLLMAFLAVGCAGLQDDRLVSVDDQTAATELASVEEAVVRLDDEEAQGRDAAILAARTKVAELERMKVSDTVFQSRLAAWSGRLSLLAGRKSEAAKRYDTAVSLMAFDVPTAILGARLAKDATAGIESLDRALIVEPGDPRLLAERALFAERLGRYAEAVAAFDAAFSALPGYYRETYGPIRDRSWNLRDAAPEDNRALAAILGKTAITWQDAVAWSVAKTHLLDFETAGKDVPADKLFPKLASAFIVAPRPDGTVPAISDTVSRSDVAWYLWRLIAEHRADRNLLTKYSRRWATMKDGVSPIADVPVSDPAFDAVMGCVENEFMALPDGRNFIPGGTVSGSEFARAVDRASE